MLDLRVPGLIKACPRKSTRGPMPEAFIPGWTFSIFPLRSATDLVACRHLRQEVDRYAAHKSAFDNLIQAIKQASPYIDYGDLWTVR